MILFVGRPLDSRKGLATLLDAVLHLHRTSNMPAFALWLVGGSQRETDNIHTRLAEIPELNQWLHTGRIIIWGRISHSSLPEFYSRATVLVVPSTREEFGLVAIESMMCSCPVVASNVGGLADLVCEQVTGHLVPPANPLVLAAVLAGYVRNSGLCRVLGQHGHLWASNAFSQRNIYQRLESLYRSPCTEDEPPFPTAPSMISRARYESERSEILEVLGANVAMDSHASGLYHTVFKCSDGNHTVAAKFFYDVPANSQTVFPIPSLLRQNVRKAIEPFHRNLYHDGNQVAPRIIASRQGPHPLLVSEWLSDIPRHIDSTNAAKYIATHCREYKPLTMNDPDLIEYFACVRSFQSCRSPASLLKIDIAGANLNSRLVGGMMRFWRTHPIAEIDRLYWHLKQDTWPLRTQLIHALLEAIGPYRETPFEATAIPALCHGDLKPPHILWSHNAIFACDYEHSQYVVGPFDEALWTYHSYCAFSPSFNPHDATTVLGRLTQDEGEARLAICWLAANLVFVALLSLQQGRSELIEKVPRLICNMRDDWKTCRIIR